MSQIARTQQIKADNTNNWWDINSGLVLNTYGYPDNFDASNPFYLYFYIDRNVRTILEIGLTLKFMKFRGYTKPLEHSHDVTIPDHTHSVSIPSHTHAINATTTDYSGTGTTAHQHTIHVNATTSSTATLESYGYKYLMIQPNTGSVGSSNPCSAYDGPGGTIWAAGYGGSDGEVSFKTNCTIQPHNHTIAARTTASGGGTTVTSAAGGGTTATSSTAAGAEFAILEDTYPSNVHVYIDGADITTNIHGPFNPSDTENLYSDLDITKFVTEGGSHEIKITSDTRGRVLPMLWIKSIIGK